MKKVIIIVICFLTFTGSEMNAQSGGGSFMQIVEETLAYFRCSITELNYQYYGLSKYSKLENVEIGQAVEHYAVGLNSLRQYTADQDPNEIILRMGFAAVDILGEGLDNVYVMFNERDGKWQSTGLGQEYYSQAFLNFQQNSDYGREATLVRVPGFNLAYAGVMIKVVDEEEGEEGEEKDVLHLIQLQVGEEIIKSNEPRPAAEVFEELGRLVGDGEDVPR